MQPPLDVSRIVAVSFQIYARRWRPHLAVATIAQLPVLVPTLVLVSLLIDATVGVLRQRTVEALIPAAVLSLALLSVSFVSAFLFVLMSGAACQLVALWLDHRDVSLAGTFRLALLRFWRLVGALLAAFAIVFGALTAIGVFLALFYIGFLVIFQIDLANDPRVFWTMLLLTGVAAVVACYVLLHALVRWAVFVQAVMIEECGPLEALRRSTELVQGNWWRTAGAMGLLIAVPLLLMTVLASLLNVALLPISGLGFLSMHLTNGAAIAIAQVVLSPIPAIGVTVLFYRLRDGPRIWQHIDERSRAR